MEEIVIFSDGGGNFESVAAAAALVRISDSREIKSVAFLGPGTNNEAEIFGALLGFAILRAENLTGGVRWVSDSEYSLKSGTAYIHGWQRNGWKTANKQPVKNQGLWRAFLDLTRGAEITPEHVRGHTGHPENEACDSACTFVRERMGESSLPSDGEILSVGSSLLLRNWLFVDARRAITLLREGIDEESVNEILRLAQLAIQTIK